MTDDAVETSASVPGHEDAPLLDTDPTTRTITAFMAAHGIEGGVRLDASEDHASTDVVTTDPTRRYTVGGALARGGMGMILGAHDTNIRRTVAMKVMLKRGAADSASLMRFIEEAQVTGQLEHPSIVPVHELGVDAGDNVFYTMKLVQGVTLREILDGLKQEREEVVSEYALNRLLNVFLKVCDALAFAHAKGVMHRDLKPANIMVGDFGEVLVMDWGLAKVLGRGRAPDQSDAPDSGSRGPSVVSARRDAYTMWGTLDGQVMGTPQFMAPEQARGDIEAIDARTDIYALGAILYNILTLRAPVTGESTAELLQNVIAGNIEPPAAVGGATSAGGRDRARSSGFSRSGKPPKGGTTNADGLQSELVLPHLPNGRVPVPLSAVAMKALAAESAERYASAHQLHHEIEQYQAGFATEAEHASLGRHLLLFVRRHKTFAASALAVFAALAVGIAATTLQWRRAVVAEKDARLNEQRAVVEQGKAVAARNEAEDARDAEKKRREELEYETFVRTIQLADAKIHEGDTPKAEELLWSIPPERRHWEWGHLMRRCHEYLLKFEHEKRVQGVSLSPDGRYAATASSDGVAKVWDLETGREYRRISVREGPLTDVAFSPDGTCLVLSALVKRVVVLWDIAADTARWRREEEGTGGLEVTCAYTLPRIAVWSYRTGVSVLDSLTGEEVWAWRPTRPGCIGVSFVPDEQLVAVRSDTEVLFLDTAHGKEHSRIHTAHLGGNGLALAPDSTMIAWGQGNGTACLSDRISGKKLGALGRHERLVSCLAFSADGTLLATGSRDMSAGVWDVASGNAVAAFSGHGRIVLEVTFLLQDQAILTGGSSGFMWGFASEKAVRTLVAGKPPNDLAFSPDGGLLAVSCLGTGGATPLQNFGRETSEALCREAGIKPEKHRFLSRREPYRDE